MVNFHAQTEVLGQLQAGSCAVIPTDTVPGLTSLPQFSTQIYTRKGRALHKPLILLAADLDQVRVLCQGWEPAWEDLITTHWPGALTLVLPASDRVPTHLAPDGTIGIRIPNQPETLALLAQSGPLTTTSVNRSGQPPLTDPQMIQDLFPDLYLLKGAYGQGVPSTVIRWQTQGHMSGWEVVRLGSVILAPDVLSSTSLPS